ncbi:MAG: ATP-dependent RecD-like DNA helicase [Clostridiales bacterium]|jgi:exodeoxyribonuclease V alpha subunit|nr:ATP-dependent RecD-like DNA helicase [Clostridiales bacterium]
MEHLKAVVERVTFANEENGFSVVKVKSAGIPELVTVVGTFAGINAGASAEFFGEWTVDAKYGKQFSASSYQETMPATLTGIEKYLGSGLIKGVGPVNARRIVRHFREKTLAVIEDAPHRLSEVPGIGEKRVEMITKAWQEHREIKNVMLFLQDHGVSTAYATKIFRTYGDRSIQTVKENPYRLADDIWGIGFVTADKIAQKLGFPADSILRYRAGLVYVLNKFSDDGHCFAFADALLERAQKILEADPDRILTAQAELVREGKLIAEGGDKLYLPPFYHSEAGAARQIAAIAGGRATSAQTEPPQRLFQLELPEPEGAAAAAEAALTSRLEKIDAVIRQTETATGVRYDEIQKDAVRSALTSRFMVLTGGPGTGKTTTTTAIINACERLGAKVLLAAPTGRAAKRLAETTKREAKTIHRLLELKPPDGYKRNQENPLPCDVLIIDEASMLDIMLTNSLLKAVRPGASVIFVGDVDQLPSVGPGSVLRDIIRSKAVRTVELRRIFRQAQSSDIIKNAHRVNAGEFPSIRNGSRTDFFFVEKDEPAEAAKTILELCKSRLPSYYHVDPVEDIQVLCPMTRGETGTSQLNAALQSLLNENRETIHYGAALYKLGDKVMQIRNNYDKNVFNGDIGRIASIDTEDRTAVIRFDGADVEYDVTELDEVTLAYAVTVHKSQGSEYPIVVCPVTTQHFMMLQKNLIYTAITRAKKVLVLVGSKKALAIAVHNQKSTERNTQLAQKLREQVGL